MNIEHGEGERLYRLKSRAFSVAELKLIVDSMASSKVLAPETTKELTDKLANLCSKHEREYLKKRVFLDSRIKSENKRIPLYIKTLNEGIIKQRWVAFRYFRYDLNKKKFYYFGGKHRRVRPAALLIINDVYYLLAYGNGHNGKGKTPEGMRDSLNDLCDLATKIPTISCVQDIPVFVQDFAEDCMSDLLTNILRRILTQFTADQMQRYGIEPDGYHEIRSWDREKHDWAWSQEPFWRVGSRKILLVPKWWVRKHFLFKTHQYLSLVILERMRDDPRYRDLSKRIMLQSLEREIPHWEYEEVTRYTLAHPDALREYHRKLPLHYNKAYGCMSDEALDKAVYVRRSRRNAG